MFHDGSYMVGMHGGWWIFLLLVIGAALLYAWQRPGRRGNAPGETLQEKLQEKLQETPHEVLRRRLANGAITAQQYEEHKALLDRDN